jgi:Kef-type K+ transport system membrane component KefB/Trk K+ transport system NAD-binding subunit
MIAEGYFVELALIVFVSLGVLWIVRLLKQPPLIGYIVAGIIVSIFMVDFVGSKDNFEPFAKIGIALLLFAVGLNLNPKSIKNLRKVAIATGVGQLIFMFITGYIISVLLGFSIISAVYIALALAFSSTIVILKFLADREETETLHGRIVIGFLIVQDLIHAIVLIVLMSATSIPAGTGIFSVAVSTFVKCVLLGGILFLVSAYVLPPITKSIARSQEMLFFFSIGWAFAVSLIFEYFLNSIEVGALAAGVTLSISPFKYEISSKMRPIRDFFMLIFFIWLGLQLEIATIYQHLVPIIVLSLLVLVGTPLIMMVLMGSLGYTRRNSFLTGLFVSQISEFSFIITATGVKLGHITTDVLSLVVFVGVITIVGSSYMITHSYGLYQFFSERLKIFERKSGRVDEGKYHTRRDYDVILFGYNRIGYDLLNVFKDIKKSFLVVDYNPETTLKLARSGIDSRYGDANDIELLDDLDFKNAQMIVSTIPEKNTNLLLLDKLKKVNGKATFIVIAHTIEDALEFYEAGAGYVIMPHFLGGKHTANLIKKYKLDRNSFMIEKENNLKELKARIKEGHRHPTHERG